MSLLMLFAVFVFFEGVANVISAVSGGRAGESMWGTLLLEGLLSIGLAVLAVLAPARMAIAVVWTIGFWAIITGGLRIGAAIRLRKLIDHEWLMGISASRRSSSERCCCSGPWWARWRCCGGWARTRSCSA